MNPLLICSPLLKMIALQLNPTTIQVLKLRIEKMPIIQGTDLRILSLRAWSSLIKASKS